MVESKKVAVVTSDGRIWNRDHVIYAVSNHHNYDGIILDLLHEGPCCAACGINDLIDLVGIPYHKISILTSNQIKSSQCKEIKTPFVELAFCQTKAESALDPGFNGTKVFACFISRSNIKRLGIASHLWNNHREQTLLTFHYDYRNDYHKTNFGLEQYLNEHWLDDRVWNFLHAIPITLDKQDYPILWNQSALDLSEHYGDFFVEIVCETYFSGRTFFLTEKIWRPILNRKPFIVQGPQWYLENLRRLGFHTFNRWWSEGYDRDINGGTFDSLLTLIDYIGNQPAATILEWYREMQPVLEHNYQTFRSLTHQKINSTEYKIPT